MNAGQTFRSWLKAQRKRHDPVGDLARDTMADLSCWSGRTWWNLEHHMTMEHDASSSALAALDRARREYTAQIPPDPPGTTRSGRLMRGVRL